jgi:hypothetical protein
MRLQGASDNRWLAALVLLVMIVLAALVVYVYLVVPA